MFGALKKWLRSCPLLKANRADFTKRDANLWGLCLFATIVKLLEMPVRPLDLERFAQGVASEFPHIFGACGQAKVGVAATSPASNQILRPVGEIQLEKL